MRNRLATIFLVILLVSASVYMPASAEVTIRLAHWVGDPAFGHSAKAMTEAVQAKVAPYGIKVDTVIWEVAGYPDKVLAQTAGGLPPDVLMEVPYQYRFMTPNIFMDLTPFLRTDREVNFNSFIPSVWSMYTYLGGTWLLPSGVSPYLMFFNKQYFHEAGMAYPDASWRWESEVESAAKKLRVVDSDGRVTRYGLALEARPWTLVFSNGGEILNADATKSLLDNPAVADICTRVQVWRQSDFIPPSANHRPTFASGQAALHAVMGTFAFPFYAQNAKAFDWSYTYVPLGAQGRAIDENTIGWGIHRNTKHPQEAWLVAKALATVSGKITMDALSHFSPLKGKLDTETIQFMQTSYGRSQEEIQVALDSVNYVRPSFRHLKGADVLGIAQGAVNSVMFQGKAPGPTLADAAARITAIVQGP